MIYEILYLNAWNFEESLLNVLLMEDKLERVELRYQLYEFWRGLKCCFQIFCHLSHKVLISSFNFLTIDRIIYVKFCCIVLCVRKASNQSTFFYNRKKFIMYWCSNAIKQFLLLSTLWCKFEWNTCSTLPHLELHYTILNFYNILQSCCSATHTQYPLTYIFEFFLMSELCFLKLII